MIPRWQLCSLRIARRQCHVQILALHRDRIGWHGRSFGKVCANPILQVEPPAMPQARHGATIDRAIVQRGASMWADVFHGVKLSLMAEDRHKAITHTKFMPLSFGDVLYLGESDRA